MTEDSELMFSIIVPAYNEEDDLPKCLDALVDLSYPEKEIIVVDDASTDGTVERARAFDEVTVLENEENLGVSGARNRGIEEAEGDVLLILNADVILEPDFLDRIKPHYDVGADFVVVDSPVINTEEPIGAYIQAKKEYADAKGITRVWSEGWSCRKDALEVVGGFDDRFPGASGEDAALGFELDEQFERVVDKTIKAPHIAPHTLEEFRRQRYGRGRGRFYFTYLHEEVPLPALLARQGIKGIGGLLLLPIVLPIGLLAAVWRAHTYSQLVDYAFPWMLLLTLIDAYETRKAYTQSLIKTLREEW